MLKGNILQSSVTYNFNILIFEIKPDRLIVEDRSLRARNYTLVRF